MPQGREPPHPLLRGGARLATPLGRTGVPEVRAPRQTGRSGSGAGSRTEADPAGIVDRRRAVTYHTYYQLNPDRTTSPCDLETWAQNHRPHKVAHSLLMEEKIEISTVFLGLN